MNNDGKQLRYKLKDDDENMLSMMRALCSG